MHRPSRNTISSLAAPLFALHRCYPCTPPSPLCAPLLLPLRIALSSSRTTATALVHRPLLFCTSAVHRHRGMGALIAGDATAAAAVYCAHKHGGHGGHMNT
ncbi:hypothetical protein ACOSP7_021449 [Xanthoceras sorbifolium]